MMTRVTQAILYKQTLGYFTWYMYLSYISDIGELVYNLNLYSIATLESYMSNLVSIFVDI